jgi:hypothetical protein
MTAFPPIWLAAAASLGYFHPDLPLITAAMATFNSLYSFVVCTLSFFAIFSKLFVYFNFFSDLLFFSFSSCFLIFDMVIFLICLVIFLSFYYFYLLIAVIFSGTCLWIGDYLR